MKEGLKKRIKNPWFWIGLVGVLLAATGTSLAQLTSWEAVGRMLLNTALNPATLAGVLLAGLGVFVDPSTPGLSDGG